MIARWTIMLAGVLVVAAAAGGMSAAPLLRGTASTGTAVDRAPTPELEAARVAVLGSMERSVAGLARRAEELELLSDLLAAAGAKGGSDGADQVSIRSLGRPTGK